MVERRSPKPQVAGSIPVSPAIFLKTGLLHVFVLDEARLEEKMKNPIAAIKKLYDETVAELKKCTWPTRQELYESTMVVVSSLILLSVFVFVADKLFLLAVNWITVTH